ncbi:hypothetical protein M514_17021 [Trichuris suis]|uniref:Uncharacterized protein n=1 Tax=Trichuris suis TaxID=68888 RepID=A0A085NN53_9BILA|nr:hypothetical protein M514_17021 [Trichuris suis]
MLELNKADGSLESLFKPFYEVATKPEYNLIAFSNYPPLFRRCVECGSNARGTAFEYQDPMIYYYISATKQGATNTLDSIPSMKALVQGSTQPYSPYTLNYKFTVGGATQTPALIMSKLPKAFQDVYSSYMTMVLKQNLVVWSSPGNKPLLPSYCSGQYKVENVKSNSITVKDTLITRRQDTSNWAASKTPATSAVFCVSSAPRTQAAISLGSGVLCLEQQAVQTLFSTIAVTAGIEECK